jgi:14-3-3 protein epsilon
MLEYLKIICKMNSPLNSEERVLLSVAFKNVLRELTESLSYLSTFESKEIISDWKISIIMKYKSKIEEKVRTFLYVAIDLIDHHLYPNADTIESKAFYTKMYGRFR